MQELKGRKRTVLADGFCLAAILFVSNLLMVDAVLRITNYTI